MIPRRCEGGRPWLAALALLGAVLALAPTAAQPAGSAAERNQATRRTVRDPEPLLALLRRVLDEPPPLHDPEKMKGWAAPYGSATFDNDAGCQRGQMLMQPANLPGVGMLSTALRRGCDRGVRHSVLLLTMEEGSALEEPVRTLLQERLGPRDAGCSDEARSAWSAGKDLSVAIVSPFYPSFAIMVVDGPVTAFDCTG